MKFQANRLTYSCMTKTTLSFLLSVTEDVAFLWKLCICDPFQDGAEALHSGAASALAGVYNSVIRTQIDSALAEFWV